MESKSIGYNGDFRDRIGTSDVIDNIGDTGALPLMMHIRTVNIFIALLWHGTGTKSDIELQGQFTRSGQALSAIEATLWGHRYGDVNIFCV